MKLRFIIITKRASKHWWLLFAVVFVTACINNPEFRSLEVKAPEQIDSSLINPESYTVRKGDTLYSVAIAYDIEYRRLANANNIPSPYVIFPGQTLFLDITNTTSPSTGSQNNNVTLQTDTQGGSASSGESSSTGNGINSQNSDTTDTNVNNANASKIQWFWPSDGKIVRTFNINSSLSKGIDLIGRLGEPVLAAASGKVVFAGSGLRGYGNMVIIEHDQNYLSAYAHTDKILVNEQEIVKAGQQIAEIGKSGSVKQATLHFEIRKKGKPVNPISYLPKRN